MQQCKDVDSPMTEAGEEFTNTFDELNEDEARRARRAIARMNYMSQDRPDLSVAARVMSQYMCRPREEIVPVIKRAIRYLKRCPRCRLFGAEHSSRTLRSAFPATRFRSYLYLCMWTPLPAKVFCFATAVVV